MKTGIFWFRRDLRLADNPALAAAATACDRLVGVFVVDPALVVPAAGTPRWTFLSASVDELGRSIGGRLVVREGRPEAVIPALAAEVGAATVWVTGDFGPYGRRRDSAVAAALDRDGRSLERVDSPYVVAPGLLHTKAGGPYQVFTPFYRAWQDVPPGLPVPPPTVRWAAPATGTGLSPPGRAASIPPAGEAAANDRLRRAVDGAAAYERDRDRVDLDATTRLSPYLKVGSLHPRQILAGLDASDGATKLRSELAWRDFAADRLWHEPVGAVWPLGLDRIEVTTGLDADRAFRAWGEGRTGYPLVDAGMRQLLEEGWMPNRVRMATASFLVKDLHLDWRWGARWFMRHLVDGDLASNRLNWQWVAGVGAHSSPWHRVFNPAAQARRHDPEGRYCARWIPELGTEAYPPPIVDHHRERAEALARRDRARSHT